MTKSRPTDSLTVAVRTSDWIRPATCECRAATVRESVGPDTKLPSLPPHHYPAEHHYQGQHELTYRAQHQELGASQVNAAVFLVFRTDRNEIFIRRQPIQHV